MIKEFYVLAIGRLKMQCLLKGRYIPVDNCKITITPQNGEAQTYTLSTDSSGLTPEIDITAPPLEYSQQPMELMPYSLCDIAVERSGFNPVFIRGCQIFPENTAIQEVNLDENMQRAERAEIINIEANTLFGNFPPKIPEDPVKPLPPPSSGVVLSQPVVPEFIIVHQGGPNSAGTDYTVRYNDYIKNVASCEIYSTWPETTIRANIFCIISFTLNRIYTEWYRGKGKPFDITNSTAFDHAFNYGRNVYENISVIVDEIFSTYIKRQGARQPLLAQYCDGVRVQCPGWLTQWGSKYLGDQGRTPYQIITNFYGSDVELTTAEQVQGIPKSYPGYTLTIGSSGTPVRTIQGYLNRISQNYPLIPKVSVDGQYGAKTAESVRVFQSIFSLPQTGNVDYATWYQLSNIYVGVTKIAELRGVEDDRNRIFIPPKGITDFYNPVTPSFVYSDDLL
ncbi:putative peptidoglycan binding domain protein [compost metagenome]